MSYFAFWFWRPIAEFLGVIVLILLIFLGLTFFEWLKSRK